MDFDVSSIQPSVSTLLIHLYKSRAHMNSPINAVVISKNSANTGVKTALVCEMCMCACVCVCVGVHACTGTVHTTISMWRNVLFIILGSTLMIEIQ